MPSRAVSPCLSPADPRSPGPGAFRGGRVGWPTSTTGHEYGGRSLASRGRGARGELEGPGRPLARPPGGGKGAWSRVKLVGDNAYFSLGDPSFLDGNENPGFWLSLAVTEQPRGDSAGGRRVGTAVRGTLFSMGCFPASPLRGAISGQLDLSLWVPWLPPRGWPCSLGSRPSWPFPRVWVGQGAAGSQLHRGRLLLG